VISDLPDLQRIVSGGQTGVDRAALDVAMALGLSCGGWVPRGRRAEDGRVPDCYPLRETAAFSYARRTRLNVRDADATLILTRGEPAGGTALTVDMAIRLERPILVLDLNADANPAAARRWLAALRVRVLNVAGPRESGCPGIYAQSRAFLEALLGAPGPAPDLADPSLARGDAIS
jgi:hypothetical protein